ncbi:peptide-methionine (S)-S-oxide reductase MsrA [Lewinella sp. IMCC34191]|uniref:peptide-methionine (S)-S-oxide reductase MsrA n=1 Tax=Lewinella sp. IMCC34191 TaxID=2259172 RepID=UPI000E28A5EA|nr:peptide-methionine (S)-S-oxide reductase MsrA [Lewinella sp. IMCC34191]
MKNLLLLLTFALSVASCDSQRPATTTSETTPTAETGSQMQLAGEMSIDELDARYPDAKKAYFAGGCFWCTEASFDRIQGVEDVWSGYAGGTSDNPNYKDVSYGKTDYAEAIVVYYDPEVIDYDKLLDIFFVAHDPTQVNRQGPDVGKQYRSAIFPINDEQRQAATAKIEKLNASAKFDKSIATTIESADNFYVAEAYHQDYYEDPSNPNQSYVQNVSRPKVEKVMKEFSDLLKPEYQQK